MVVPLLALLILALVALTVWALYRAAHPPYAGRERVLAVDLEGRGRTGLPPTVGRVPGMTSGRLGLTGRPDELRSDERGNLYPVEIKSGSPAPGGRPYPSHRMQVLAYCALLEESRGITPPFGLLVYGEGSEFRIPWNEGTRRELLDLLDRMGRPYDGSVAPSYPKCVRCRYRDLCEGAQSVGARSREGSRRNP